MVIQWSSNEFSTATSAEGEDVVESLAANYFLREAAGLKKSGLNWETYYGTSINGDSQFWKIINKW